MDLDGTSGLQTRHPRGDVVERLPGRGPGSVRGVSDVGTEVLDTQSDDGYGNVTSERMYVIGDPGLGRLKKNEVIGKNRHVKIADV